MKRRIARIVVCAAVLVAVSFGAFLWASAGQSRFDGSRVRNPDAYLLTFSRMNQDDAHSMHMDVGDRMNVEFEIDRGRVDVCVDFDGDEPVYRANHMDSGCFALPAARAGEYSVSVHAENAVGRLAFVVERAEAPDGD